MADTHHTSTSSQHWGDATDILTKAGVEEDTTYYGEFDAPDQRAVQAVAQRIQVAWATNDADAFAEVFAENGSLLLQDTQLTSREEIREFMTAGFAGPFKGAHVEGGPLHLEFLSDTVAVLVTHGGIIFDGQSAIEPQNEIRAIWVISRSAPGVLELVSHQSSPVHS
ncbi:SgcJ/EcaC family oxidoreductase [Aeromicrobium sp. CF3.5]|uniref:SgcJ/EcaC family oxidoreductase n=1 Tax=Aeromicrobium sp. CF3.5 TaxID=3373078 RepID=UPI003EE44E29